MTSAGSLPLPSGVTLRDRFTGKEDQTPDFGIAFTDFGARHYSLTLRRWLAPDPLADQYPGISPYAYCNGNPVTRVDTDGRIWDTIIDVGSVVYDLGSAVFYGIKGDSESVKKQLKTAGADLAFALIPGASASCVKILNLLDKGFDAFRLGKELNSFEKAAEFGVDSYNSLRKAIVENYGTILGWRHTIL